MPSAVADFRNVVSSSIVSKVFSLLVHSRDEVLVVLDVYVYHVMVPIIPGGCEILLQRGVGAVARHGEDHVVDAIRV